MSAADDDLLRRLGAALDRAVPPAPAHRVEEVHDVALQIRAKRRADGGGSSRRTWLLTSAAAAVGAVAGGAIATAVQDDAPTATAVPTEPMRWESLESRVEVAIAGQTINHTWGVELVLEATGFPIDAPHRVVFVGADGVRTDAGGFVGSAKPMVCRCNAPVLRAAVATMEIIDADGTVVARGAFA